MQDPCGFRNIEVIVEETVGSEQIVALKGTGGGFSNRAVSFRKCIAERFFQISPQYFGRMLVEQPVLADTV